MMQLTSLFRDKISIRAINDDQSKTIKAKRTTIHYSSADQWSYRRLG
ncbi:hypothetical protein LAZ44_17525 [Vibrio alginolyticus]|nr:MULTISPECIES: hypothetical protein [unclassified Vibrio]MCA2451705.1 hypothetical protein [Vibrio alginolyticus]MCA2475522.1 hypothetical protein [Vibrio alginolyticus]MDW2155550.1 hypothetical protein [Vibrio sp. 2092]